MIYGQGFGEGVGPLDYGHVDIMTMRAGQPLRLGTSGAQNNPRWAIQITAHLPGSPGNVDIRRLLNLAPSTADYASIRIPHGTSPTSPANGDIWTTPAGIFVRINGATRSVNVT